MVTGHLCTYISLNGDRDDRDSFPTESVTHVISAWETVRHAVCTAGHSTYPHATASSCSIHPGHTRQGQDRELSLWEKREKPGVVTLA